MTPPWWCHLRAGQGRSLECEPAHGLQVYRVRSPPPTQPSLTQMVFMHMVSAPSYRHRSNHLLAGLSIDIQTRWASHMEIIDMPLGQVLCEAGRVIEYVYFPTTAVVSLLYVMSDGGSAEIAIIGNDGLVGVSVLMGAVRPRAAPWCKTKVKASESKQIGFSLNSNPQNRCGIFF